MGLYEQFVLPWVLHCACASPAITAQRKKIVPLASGTVLEVGMGTGLNLKYYTAETTDLVHGLEPSAPMRRRAQNVATQIAFEVNIIDGVAEQIPLPDGSVDTVMLTFTLCTLPDPHTALHEMARVLTDTGTLLFCEHGLAPDATVASVQMRLNPIWKRFAGGCNLQRNIPHLLEEAGFEITERYEGYLPRTPRFAGYNYWGQAKKLRRRGTSENIRTTS